MEIADDRGTVRLDAPLVAHASLSATGSARERPDPPAVVIVRGADPWADEDDVETVGGAPPAVVTRGLATLDAWIVDLSLRRRRVTVVGPTDVYCSASLVGVPQGWMAEVAARGLLSVVVRHEPGAPVAGASPVPERATATGVFLAAYIPVCLSE